MQASLVLTVIGTDRPGLVEVLSDTAHRHGANWEASRMTRLGGRFAGLLLVTVDADRAAALKNDLEGLSRAGLRVVVEPSVSAEPRGDWQHLQLELLGTDRPGIVQKVSATLSRRGVNVEDLSTECTSAPMAGGDVFKISALLACPPGVSIDELRLALEQAANDLMVDINLVDSGTRNPDALIPSTRRR
jgi:glycine cleavage system regulatory protein